MLGKRVLFNYTEINIPINIEAEEAVLGGLLLDSRAINRIVHMLNSEHFSLMSHQAIYDCALYLYNKGETVDLMSITQRLAATNQLTEIGGTAKLAQLVNRTVSAVNIDRYALLLIDKYRRRKLIEIGNTLVSLGSKERLDIEEIESLVKKHFERWFNPSQEISRITQPVEISYQYSRTTQKSQPGRENIGITETVSLKTTTNLVSEISELGLELKQRAKKIHKKSL